MPLGIRANAPFFGAGRQASDGSSRRNPGSHTPKGQHHLLSVTVLRSKSMNTSVDCRDKPSAGVDCQMLVNTSDCQDVSHRRS